MNDDEEVGFTPGDDAPDDEGAPEQAPAPLSPLGTFSLPGLANQPAFAPQPLLQASTLPSGIDSLSRSYHGPTAQGVARGNQQQAQVAGRAQSFANKDLANTNQDIAGVNQGISEEKDALDTSKQVSTDYEARLADIDTRKQALFTEAARQEDQARQEAKISGAEFMNSYTQQLAAVRAMTVDINGPLSKLSSPEKGGLSLALFAQGFLAAQGINIDVQGQVNRWVDSSIQEQRRQIDQKERGAQDTLNLWQIARQNSHDDMEARQRYRGYVLEGLASQTELAAARFNSGLAKSQAEVAKAKLTQAGAVNSSTMRNQHEERVLKEKMWQTDTTYKMQSLNLEEQRIQVERDKIKAKADAGRTPRQQIIVDPSDGKRKWIVREDRINFRADAKEAAQAQATYDATDKLIKEAIEFRQGHRKDLEYGKLDFLNNREEAKRAYAAQVEAIAIGISAASFGKTASDKEAERIKSLMPFDKWYQHGDNADVWTKLREDQRAKFEATISAHADAIPESQQEVVPRNTANPAVKAEFEATKAPPAVAKFVGEELGKITSIKGFDTPGENNYASKLYSEWQKSDSYKNLEVDGSVPDLVTLSKEREGAAKGEPGNMTQWALAMDHLAAGWLRPEEVKEFGDKNFIYFGTKNETPAEIKAESLKAIQQIASGETENGKEINGAAVEYARWLLKQDEEEANKLISPPRDIWSSNPIDKIKNGASSGQNSKSGSK